MKTILIRYVNRIKIIIFKIKEDNISEYAAEAAYFTIISFIPFFSIFMTLIKFINIEKESIFLILKNFIPYNLQNLIFSIINESSLKSIKIISFSIIILLWSAGKGFFSLTKGLKKIYKINIKSNFFLRVLGSIYSLILIFLMVIFIAFMILGQNLYVFILKQYPEIFKYIIFINKFRIIFIIILLTIIFYFLYRIISDYRSKEFSHIYGAIFSAVIWQISINFISWYANFKYKFTNLYGSLSLAILILLWLYISMYIILIGAKLNTIIRKNE